MTSNHDHDHDGPCRYKNLPQIHTKIFPYASSPRFTGKMVDACWNVVDSEDYKFTKLGYGRLRRLGVIIISARAMSLRNVSYEAFVFSVFSRNRGKTKPLTWRSVSSLLPSQAAPNLTASRHNLVAIQLSIKTSFTWHCKSLRLIFIHFRLTQVTRLRQMFEMS